jgi:integrase
VSVQKLPSGRWRAQVYDPRTGKNVSVSKVLGGPGTFRTKTEAKDARSDARRRLKVGRSGVTVEQFRARWISDPLFARPKLSTDLHNAERTKAFAERYGTLPLDQVGDDVVAEWLAGGRRNGSVPALRAMFNDAASAKAGRLITVNPFAGLGLTRTRGNRDRKPPDEQGMWHLIRLARQLTPPSFASWLETACFTGIRPGELDALQWPQVRWDDGEIDVDVQWNAKVREFTAPKYGPYTVALVGHVRETLTRMKQDRDAAFVFTTLRGTHYTPSSRIHHWNRVRCAAAMGETSLYMATRHYFGWYALNVLELEPHVIAEQLGHKDGGKLVIQLYGHPDRKRARAKIRDAFDRTAQVRPLRLADHQETG